MKKIITTLTALAFVCGEFLGISISANAQVIDYELQANSVPKAYTSQGPSYGTGNIFSEKYTGIGYEFDVAPTTHYERVVVYEGQDLTFTHNFQINNSTQKGKMTLKYQLSSSNQTCIKGQSIEKKADSGNLTFTIKKADLAKTACFTPTIDSAQSMDGWIFALKGLWKKDGDADFTQQRETSLIYVYLQKAPTAPSISTNLASKTFTAGDGAASIPFAYKYAASRPFGGEKITWEVKKNGAVLSAAEIAANGLVLNSSTSAKNGSLAITPNFAGVYTVTAKVEVTDIKYTRPHDSSAGSFTYHLDPAQTVATITVNPKSAATSLSLKPVPIDNQYDVSTHCKEPDGSSCPIYWRHLGLPDDNITTTLNTGAAVKDAYGNALALDKYAKFDIFWCDGPVLTASPSNCTKPLWDDAVSADPYLAIAPNKPAGIWKIELHSGALSAVSFISVQGAAVAKGSTTVRQKEGAAGFQSIPLDVYPAPNALNCSTSPAAPGISVSSSLGITFTSSTAAGEYVWENCTIWNTFIGNTSQHYSYPMNITVVIEDHHEPTLTILPSKQASEFTKTITSDTVTLNSLATDTSGEEVATTVSFESNIASDEFHSVNKLTVSELGKHVITAHSTIEDHEVTAVYNYLVYQKPTVNNLTITGAEGKFLSAPLVYKTYPGILSISCTNLPGDAHINSSNWKIEGTYNSGVNQTANCKAKNSYGDGPSFSIIFKIAQTPSPSFVIQDIPASNQFKSYIVELYSLGLTSGCETSAQGSKTYTKYCPSRLVTRGQMASYLYKLALKPARSSKWKTPFTDLGGYTGAADIAWAYNTGVTSGYNCERSGVPFGACDYSGEKVYMPTRAVSRSQMAIYIYNFFGKPKYSAPAKSPFTDIAPGTVGYKEVCWLKASGIVSGYEDGSYKPKKELKRDGMAKYMIGAYNKKYKK